MKNGKKFIFVLFLSLIIASQFIVILSTSMPVAAASNLWNLQQEQGMNKVGAQFGESGTSRDIRVVVVDIIKIFLTFVGIILLIYILLGGYKWMTSGGNQDKVDEAKKQIKNAVIGIVIILASYAITNYLARCSLDILNGEGTWMCNFIY